ncbi:hypothetical protein JB92DRAFT_3149272 [Gautieria morchelliformis]|nr:hypothetical protein JB92DRAFT_3149272 [Gautieria morchelliformis]
MPTTDNKKSESPLSSNVRHHATSSPGLKPDPFPAFNLFPQAPTQPRRAAPAMDLSSNMDAQPSFSSQELVVNPDGQPAALHSATSSQFVQSFQSFGNIQGVEMPGSALGAGETQYSKLAVVDNLLDRYDVPPLLLISSFRVTLLDLLVSRFVFDCMEFI